MVRLDDLLAVQIGYGAGDLEHAVVGSGGEAELFKGVFQLFLRVLVDNAKAFKLRGVYFGVAGRAASLKSALLDLARLVYALFDRSALFGSANSLSL